MMADYDSPHDTYESESSQQQQQQQQQRASLLERGRAIKLLRNGDPFFPGRAFVINHRKYPMLEVLLDDASQALRANFGAVRCIYTPKHGTRLHDISELEDHQTYVASGGERFKKLHYLDIAEGKRVASKDKGIFKLPPVRRYDVEGRALRLSRSENVIIYVYRNGDPLTLPAKILLVKSTLQNWEPILDEITRKVSLPNSAVLKLYSMTGELITSAQQLEYNGMYVAAGKERFKRIDYPDPKSFSPNSSPKMSRKSYTKSDGSNTHTTTANSYGSFEHGGQRRPVREEYDFFNSKPQQHRRGPTKETDLDRDDGGIYKGRLNNRERAREVDETRDTKVELPVDYRNVETVDEENLYSNAGKTPRRPLQQQVQSQAKANSRQRTPPVPTFKNSHKTNQDNDDDDNNHHNNRFPTNNYHNRNPDGFDNDYQRQTPPLQTKQIESDHKRRLSPPLQIKQIESDLKRRLSPPLQTKHIESDLKRRLSPPRQIDDDDDQDHLRTPQLRRQKDSSPLNSHSNKNNENHAATVIQSHVRGYLTRKQTSQTKQDNNLQTLERKLQRQSSDIDEHVHKINNVNSSLRYERQHDDDGDDNV